MSKVRWAARAGVALLATMTAGIGAVPAFAAADGVAKVTGSTVRFTAGAGKVNNVVITRSGRTVTIDDRVRIKPGKGCKQVKGDKTRVRCTTKKAPTYVVVELGNRADKLINKTGIRMDADGGTGADQLTGGSARDNLYGESGNDRLDGRGGDDYLKGDEWEDNGADRLFGGGGTDELQGYGGNDFLYGESGKDFIYGGLGDDLIDGGSGDDHLYGENEDRGFQWGPPGADVFRGGSGRDSVTYYTHDSGTGVTVDLDGQARDDGEPGEGDTVGTDVEDVSGSPGDDVLIGNAAANFIGGSSGDDVIRGGGGNDVLGGDFGVDKIYGEDGDDELFAIEDADGRYERADTVDGGGNATAAGDRCEASSIDIVSNCER